MPPEASSWLQEVREYGPFVTVLVFIIIGFYTGKIRAEREFKALEAINERLTTVISENSKTTAAAAEMTKTVVAELKQARQELEVELRKTKR